MSLLTNVMDHSLDDGYAEAAARKKAEGAGGMPKTLRARLGLAAGLVLAALVVTVGAAQARVAAPVVAKEREELIDRIDRETEAADKLEKSVDATARRRQRAAAGGAASERRRRPDRAGGHPVGRGGGARPGRETGRERRQGSHHGRQRGSARDSGFSDTGRVRDRDMQRVVNGLWESGAEAVSINGQRLTALSAIRAAGDAILVDNRPLVPPYTVLAVGDGKRLSTRFQDSADGLYLHALQENYGIRTAISVEDDLRLPAAPSVIVRTARAEN